MSTDRGELANQSVCVCVYTDRVKAAEEHDTYNKSNNKNSNDNNNKWQ